MLRNAVRAQRLDPVRPCAARAGGSDPLGRHRDGQRVVGLHGRGCVLGPTRCRRGPQRPAVTCRKRVASQRNPNSQAPSCRRLSRGPGRRRDTMQRHRVATRSGRAPSRPTWWDAWPAALWIGTGLLVTMAGALLRFHPGASRAGMIGVGVGCVAIGSVVLRVPWARWRRSATLWLVPVALGMITLYNSFTGHDAFVYGTFFLVVFVWIGFGHPRWTSVRFAPLLAAAYALPLLDTPVMARAMGLSSALLVVPCCVLVGELVAWVGGRLRHSESAKFEAEARFRTAFEDAPIGMALALPDGQLVRVNRAYAAILGYDPERARGADHQRCHPSRRLGGQRRAGRGPGGRGHRPVSHGEALPPRPGTPGVGHSQRQLRARRRRSPRLSHRADRRRDRAS